MDFSNLLEGESIVESIFCGISATHLEIKRRSSVMSMSRLYASMSDERLLLSERLYHSQRRSENREKLRGRWEIKFIISELLNGATAECVLVRQRCGSTAKYASSDEIDLIFHDDFSVSSFLSHIFSRRRRPPSVEKKIPISPTVTLHLSPPQQLCMFFQSTHFPLSFM